MNQRINDIAEHCDFYVGNEHYDKPREEQQRLFMEQFARLMLQECIDVIQGMDPGYKDYRNQIEDAFRRDLVMELKQHFGIQP